MKSRKLAEGVDNPTASRTWLESRETHLLDLLEQLVVIESHAAHQAGVAAVAVAMVAELAPVGFSFKETVQEPVPSSQRWLEELLSPGVL